MARKKADAPETLAERIDFLLKLGGGICPYCIVVRTQADLDEVTRLLKANKKASKVISARLE